MCGILGIFNHPNAAELAVLGLFAEQHRGQESCGMSVLQDNRFILRKKMGLVKEVFSTDVMETMKGTMAVGHVRYPTRGSSTDFNSQPHIVETLSGPCYTLASNGDIVNYHEMRQQLEKRGVFFFSSNDGELILKYIVSKIELDKFTPVDAIKDMMKHVKGAYSTVFATREEMYWFRDPHAFRPMVYGTLKDNTYIVASESCALNILDVENIKEMKPAEIIVLNSAGMKSVPNDPSDYREVKTDRHCIFEHIYFSRPDSFEFGENVYDVRIKIGHLLAAEDEALQPDVVMPVPDSSNFMAMGYAEAKKLPYHMGLIRNHYVGRTFIKPDQAIRDESVKQKFNVLPNFFKNKKVILVDDSIVRGTTIKKIVQLIKSAGAKEVHLRIGSPQVKYSCYYGIDTPTKDELIANRKTMPEIKAFLGVASINHISLEQLRKCVSKPEDYCYSCFSGTNPIIESAGE